MREPAEVLDVADEQRLVEAEVVAQLRDGVLGRVLAEHELHGVARDQLERQHDDEHDPEQDRDREQEPAQREDQRSSQTLPSGRKYSTGWTVKPFTCARVATISLVL